MIRSQIEETEMRRIPLLVLLSVPVVLSSAVAASPTPRAGVWIQAGVQPAAANGAISRVVLDGYSDTPIADVMVSLTGVVERERVVSVQQATDARGRFVFENLPPADYQIRASGSGYAQRNSGRDGKSSSPLSVRS